jgi:hypothetical protein
VKQVVSYRKGMRFMVSISFYKFLFEIKIKGQKINFVLIGEYRKC